MCVCERVCVCVCVCERVSARACFDRINHVFSVLIFTHRPADRRLCVWTTAALQ